MMIPMKAIGDDDDDHPDHTFDMCAIFIRCKLEGFF